ncbi:hypothetical protein NQ318_018864 [Aromia moschata]|uniref:Uncharacterized protein n=1 Tax=Aromia moschata TaxID=1265417 RepID=A0AAV8ZIH1_9CUCU|nr:hypothetical protein NQ318_018864 [Aromia moschata]
MQMINDHTLQIENVLFSDESTFTFHCHVNRQNCRCWSRENPHWMRELHTQNTEKVNVWRGIIGENIIGTFFIDGNLNGETYLALLQNNDASVHDGFQQIVYLFGHYNTHFGWIELQDRYC